MRSVSDKVLIFLEDEDFMYNSLKKNQIKIWYMICFLAIGIIDQRKGSALGEVQMAAENCLGIVLVFMLLPSLHIHKFRNKVYLGWTVASVVVGGTACIWGYRHWQYPQQWITGVLNIVAWGYLVIYVIREWKSLEVRKRFQKPLFLTFCIMLLLMFCSLREGILPLWMLLIFGGFYLIGIPAEQKEDFFQGMLNGIILWFFVQQIAAFGFRPYDYVRYKGMYVGETQSGLFYMIVYCAFLCKWIWAKQIGKNKWWVWSYFFLSAASISFLLFTGGRSSLMGAAVATLCIYVIYDMIQKKSFYGFMKHVLLFGLCIIISFPLVYGAIRYFPTILHHPIWFEGEYNEETSVRSFDSWDSDRYITFEEAVDYNIGRILKVLGIDIEAWKESSNPLIMKVYARESTEPGSSPDNPYILSGADRYNQVELREIIFSYYFTHLNLWGHSVEESDFYTIDYHGYHAHNMLLQMAYDYGIIVGILFLLIVIYSIVHLFVGTVKGIQPCKMVCFTFLSAILFYGMTESAVNPATISWSLFYLILCFVFEEGREIKSKKVKKVESQRNRVF